MQMLMALAIAFQSKKHGDYKLKAFPNMFYRVLGSLFRKFFFKSMLETEFSFGDSLQRKWM